MPKLNALVQHKQIPPGLCYVIYEQPPNLWNQYLLWRFSFFYWASRRCRSWGRTTWPRGKCREQHYPPRWRSTWCRSGPCDRPGFEVAELQCHSARLCKKNYIHRPLYIGKTKSVPTIPKNVVFVPMMMKILFEKQVGVMAGSWVRALCHLKSKN